MRLVRAWSNFRFLSDVEYSLSQSGLIPSLLLVTSSGSLTCLWHFSRLLPNDNAIIIDNLDRIFANSPVVLVDKQARSSAANVSLSRVQGQTLHWVFADIPAFNCHMHRLDLWFRKTVDLKQATGEFYLGNIIR